MMTQKEKETMIEFSKLLKKLGVSKLDRTYHTYYGGDILNFLGKKIRANYKKVADKYALVKEAVELIERERIESGKMLIYTEDFRELEWHFGVRFRDYLYF